MEFQFNVVLIIEFLVIIVLLVLNRGPSLTPGVLLILVLILLLLLSGTPTDKQWRNAFLDALILLLVDQKGGVRDVHHGSGTTLVSSLVVVVAPAVDVCFFLCGGGGQRERNDVSRARGVNCVKRGDVPVWGGGGKQRLLPIFLV